ncbi:MAG: hypothetical protein EPN97_17005 [Alphaproteobacteria bacterium]|nr:MAG: hypothetical protein EPN97_17005 [Alphaproteobacteria bacterium]
MASTAEDRRQLTKSTADEVVTYLLDAYQDERGVHAETVIGAAAALTGEHILRACHTDEQLAGNGWITSSPADAFLFEDEQDITIYDLIKAITGLKDDMPDMVAITVRTAQAIGGSPFPPLTVDQVNYPHEWSPNAGVTHRDAIMRMAEKRGLSPRERALALGMATAILINSAAGMLDKKISALLAMEIMTGVTKMKPLEQSVN